MGVTAVAVIGASITGAEARIPGVGNGVQQSTDSPDLRSVTIDAPDLRRVKYCFDQPLNGSPAQTGFVIQTYDSKRFIRSASATVSTGDQSCVQAIMGSGADIAQGTIGSVDSGAVADAAGRNNVASSEPLGGSGATPVSGRTTGPDLTAATKDLDDKSILFVFDENLDGAQTPVAGNFRYVDDKGFQTTGTSLTRPAGNTVRVKFTETPGGGTVAAAAGAFSAAGAVQDAPQSGVYVPGTPLSTPSGTGAITFTDNNARTRLTSVAGDGARQLRLTYNNPVNSSGSPGRIVAILDDGTSVPASSIVDISSNSIRATFQSPGAPDINVDPTALVRVVDSGAGVATDDSEGLGSLPATVSVIAPKDSPGFTNGPDLLASAYDAPGSRVFYAYDENVGSASAPSFFVTSQSGSSSGTTGTATFSAGVASVTFGTSANSSIAAGGTQGATSDALGNPSPQSAVSYRVEPGPATPTPTQTTPTGTTPPPPPPPVKRAKFRTTFSSFKVKSRTRYSGRIRSSGRGCKSGRRIALKRRGKTIRNGFTKGDGTFSIARSKGTRGKRGVYVVVTERTTKTVVCTAKGSKKLRRG